MCADGRKAASATVVLFSGGVDSATLAAHLLADSLRPELFFVDYGQPSRVAERASARALAAEWSLGLSELTVEGLLPGNGEMVGRNALLTHLALAHRPHAEGLYLGIHAGTGYTDCSSEFVELMQRSLDLHTGGQTRISAPFVGMTKADVVALARAAHVPFGLTHSCEVAAEPCGFCPSCTDREALDLR
jgi:7-cyano-7-deazaguanine synthase